MANPYSPVTTTSDTAGLTEDEWGSQPGVVYRHANKRAAAIIGTLSSIPRSVVAACTAALVLVVVCLIIAAALGSGDQNSPFDLPGYIHTSQGLNFFPVPEDGTILIRFNAHKYKSDEPIKKNLDDVLRPYEYGHQSRDPFVNCNDTYHPANKSCQFSLSLLGDECVTEKDYGYNNQRPCVFLQLSVAEGETIKRISSGTPLWPLTEKEEVNPVAVDDDPFTIPVTCEGTTEEDKKALEKGDIVGSKRIAYYPEDAYIDNFYFRQRDASLPFLKPGVMVQFTSLLTRRLFHLTCVAWGQIYTVDGLIKHHDLLATRLAIYIDHDN